MFFVETSASELNTWIYEQTQETFHWKVNFLYKNQVHVQPPSSSIQDSMLRSCIWKNQ